MAKIPVPLEAVGVKSYSELLALPTKEIVRRLDGGTVVPLHEGDAFLAVLVLRGVGDLADATGRLEKVTKALVVLTVGLVVVALITLVVA